MTTDRRSARPAVGFVTRADVDPEILDLRHALAILLAEEVARGLAHDAGNGPGGRHHRHALADEHRCIPAADLGDEEHARGVDVLDDQADLVDVADERDARAAARIDGGEGVAENVAAHLCEFAAPAPDSAPPS
jgi:hypothetical protein